MRNKTLFVGTAESCDFATIGAAIHAAEQTPDDPVTIFIAQGEYHEYLTIYRSNLTLVGVGSVAIIGSRGAVELDEQGVALGTFRTATVLVNAAEVTLCNLTIVNAAGAGETAGQAIALYLFGQRLSLRGCRILGNQDTLCIGPLPSMDKSGNAMTPVGIRQVYDSCTAELTGCYIAGTVDFIFGGGQAVFRGCQLHSLLRPDGKESYITAACTPAEQVVGFCFEHCLLTADKGVASVYLGRPWRPHAHTEFRRCRMGTQIHPQGWHNWGNPQNELTARYSEHDNRYCGRTERASWISFHEQGEGNGRK